MPNIALKNVGSYSNTSAYGSILNPQSQIGYVIDYDSGFQNFFGFIFKGSVINYGNFTILTTYNYGGNLMENYAFDYLSSSGEDSFEKSSFIKKGSYIYQIWSPTSASNRKLFYKRFLITSIVNDNGCKFLEYDITFGIKQSTGDFRTASTAGANIGISIIKHNGFYVLLNTVVGSGGLATLDLVFTGDNLFIGNAISLVSANYSYIYNRGNLQNYLNYFVLTNNSTLFYSYTLTGGGIISTPVTINYGQNYASNNQWHFHKLKQNGKYTYGSTNYMYYNALSGTAINSTVPSGGTNHLSFVHLNNNFVNNFVGVDLLNQRKVDLNANLRSATESYGLTLPSSSAYYFRIEISNDHYIVLDNATGFKVIQVTDSGTALEFEATGNAETITYTIPTTFPYTKISLSGIEDVQIGSLIEYGISFDGGTYIGVNNFENITIPTGATTFKLKFYLSTSSPLLTPSLQKINFIYS